MRKIMMIVGLVLATVMGVGTAMAGTSGTTRTAADATRLYHPCDVDRNGRANGSTEGLCMVVWGHDAYSVTMRDGSMTETPAGPVVVVELMNEGRSEGAAYVRSGLSAAVKDYARRDK